MASELNKPHFQNANKARTYLEALRWPNGPVCPHCGSVSKEHYALHGEAHRAGLWKCKDCREQFSVTVGTVFERSKIALNVWLQAVYLLCASKKGISSKQLERMLGVTYKTAWFMTHRIREAMTSGSLGPLGGAGKIVEADETYYGTEAGGSIRKLKGEYGNPARGSNRLRQMNKVVSLVEREGKVRSFHLADITGENLKRVLTKEIHKDSHLMTDSSFRYNEIKRAASFAKISHVNHSKKEYARGEVTTNTVEGYFSILKRGLNGVYHHVSAAHLQRYVNEFDFRYNNRESLGVDDVERTNEALKGISGKRLTYRRIEA